MRSVFYHIVWKRLQAWCTMGMKMMRGTCRAFSLIEISIVLIIIGVLSAAVLKARDVIESARLQSVALEIVHYRTLIERYRDQFGKFPGHTASSSTMRLQESWNSLFEVGLLSEDVIPSSKMGGQFSVMYLEKPYRPGVYLLLSESLGSMNRGALTPQQALKLKEKVGEVHPSRGQILIANAAGAGKCVNADGQYNLKESGKACLVLVPL